MLRVLDPVEYAKTAAAPSTSYTPEQLEALKKQILEDPTKLQNMLKDLGKSGGDAPQAPSVPAPEAPPAPPPASSGSQP
jgi:hypothetical protein